jgi:hypothetical protein
VGLTGLTGEEHWSDRCATMQSRIFEAEDTRRDSMAASRLSRVRSLGIRPMEKI